MMANSTAIFYNETNKTLLEYSKSKMVIIIGSWKHYLRFLNIFISLSFLCNLALLAFIIFNLARYVCCLNINKRRKESDKKYNCILNYVTLAFIFHQAFIDLFRMLYFLFYINNLKLNNWQKNVESEIIDYLNNNFLSKYCFYIASLYSILTMVTLINTLAIFISETCRFYDLKLDSNDSSNICCVLFGIMLIWLSSLIIISSIMMVGIASSAAPNQCDDYITKNNPHYSQSQLEYQQLIATTTTTRSFVINFVWLLVILIVMSLVVFYSRSLFKELNSLNYRHHRISIYALYQPNRSQSFQQRHFFIVKHTSKRLVVLFGLILVFCLSWLPNFCVNIVNIFLKNNSNFMIAASLFCSILWLMNPCFNVFVFTFFVIKTDSEDYSFLDENDNGVFNKFTNLFSFIIGKGENYNRNKSKSIFDDIDGNNNELTELQLLNKPFDEVKLKVGNRFGIELNNQQKTMIFTKDENQRLNSNL